MLTAIAFILLLLVVLLTMPVTLLFQLSRRRHFEGYVMLQWAFGLVQVRIPVSGIQQKARAPREKKKKRSQRRSHGGAKPLALIRYRPFRRRVFRLLSGLWRAIRKEDVVLQIRLGLGDPADTGRIWALVGPVSALLANVKEMQVEIEPEFMEAVFELDSRGTIRIIPLQIIALVVAFFLSPPFWAGMRRMRQAG